MDDLGRFPDPEDRELVRMLILLGAGSAPVSQHSHDSGYYSRQHPSEQRYAETTVPSRLTETVLSQLSATGRLLVANPSEPQAEPDPGRPLKYDTGGIWKLSLRAEKNDAGYRLTGSLVKEQEEVALSEIKATIAPDLVIAGDRLLRLDPGHHLTWAEPFSGESQVRFTAKQADRLVESILSDPSSPPVSWPREMAWKTVEAVPEVRALFRIPPQTSQNESEALFPLTLEFDYRGCRTQSFDPGERVIDSMHRKIYPRNRECERDALSKAAALPGVREPGGEKAGKPCTLLVEPEAFASACHAMISWDWRVDAAGKRVLQGGNLIAKVSSGVDWFDLEGKVEFEGTSFGILPLLKAIESGEKWIRLGDGSIGVLPEKWIERYRAMAGFGEKTARGLRFTRAQGLFLDSWLSEADVRADRGFRKFVGKIRSFTGIRPAKTPADFHGKLRPYQKEGLSWLDFLWDFGLGGILADDMGLGKTIQVLALLQQKRIAGRRAPSIAIVPKSVVGNWLAECSRFAPRLKTLDYTGPGRHQTRAEVGRADLVVTTYQTLLRDIGHLKDTRFDLAIADEAQNIKNPDALSSKACRLIQAERRLAMTGTPVENGLDDLFSIMDFANPGMLTPKARAQLLPATDKETPDAAALKNLSLALRPVILRRTKEEVLKDLPRKFEQILYCELSKPEERLYSSLRDHYRVSLVRKVEESGMARSRIQILTALLRLRQAACHPKLLDTARPAASSSAKLELLMEKLREALSEGHKCLVFSQFTSLLAIVLERLRHEGIEHEYLDGQTRNRSERVRHFQEDPACRVFLISLKAGGTGLNLTAADYVFMLDPWWNPAAEAQAIDRTHRIGQKRKVFAYRLIAKGTVEEKILQLQEKKRELASAVISSDAGFFRKMTRADLEMLLA